MKDIRVAAVVCRSPVGKTRENLDRMRTWTDKAARQGAAVVCFPELNLTGYTTRPEIADSGRTGSRPGDRRLLQIAADTGMAILAGLAEKGRRRPVMPATWRPCPTAAWGLPQTAYRRPRAAGFQPGRRHPPV